MLELCDANSTAQSMMLQGCTLHPMPYILPVWMRWREVAILVCGRQRFQSRGDLPIAGVKVDVADARVSIARARVDVLGMKVSVVGAKVSIVGARVSIVGAKVSIAGAKVSIAGAKVSIAGAKVSIVGAKVSIVLSKIAKTSDTPSVSGVSPQSLLMPLVS
jgi:hypothetical protein